MRLILVPERTKPVRVGHKEAIGVACPWRRCIDASSRLPMRERPAVSQLSATENVLSNLSPPAMRMVSAQIRKLPMLAIQSPQHCSAMMLRASGALAVRGRPPIPAARRAERFTSKVCIRTGRDRPSWAALLIGSPDSKCRAVPSAECCTSPRTYAVRLRPAAHSWLRSAGTAGHRRAAATTRAAAVEARARRPGSHWKWMLKERGLHPCFGRSVTAVRASPIRSRPLPRCAGHGCADRRAQLPSVRNQVR
jgi:hypothetical protein